jgi:hypothetical protein
LRAIISPQIHLTENRFLRDHGGLLGLVSRRTRGKNELRKEGQGLQRALERDFF